MKELKYLRYPPSFGGAALPGCGTIYYTEIAPTLAKLQEDLDLPAGFDDYVTGSTGKREYSGDIDIIVDENLYSVTFAMVKELLTFHLGEDNVIQRGKTIHVRYKIANFDESKTKFGPRTGFVQIDFFMGNMEWGKFYHHASEDSCYKGAHRNLAIAAIAAIKDNNSSRAKDQFGRPIREVRWKWGPNGLSRIIRHSIRVDNIRNDYLKKQEDEIILGPFFDVSTIQHSLFERPEENDLDSLETLIHAVKRNFDHDDQNKIWKRMAKNFSEWSDGKYFQYPDEISRFMEPY